MLFTPITIARSFLTAAALATAEITVVTYTDWACTDVASAISYYNFADWWECYATHNVTGGKPVNSIKVENLGVLVGGADYTGNGSIPGPPERANATIAKGWEVTTFSTAGCNDGGTTLNIFEVGQVHGNCQKVSFAGYLISDKQGRDDHNDPIWGN